MDNEWTEIKVLICDADGILLAELKLPVLPEFKIAVSNDIVEHITDRWEVVE